MNEITLLSQETIDKIAAGEVVERPSSVVKELVENAVDAGANAITVEIRDGGTSLIRITDNGCGIPREQVRTAYLQHATSKIRTVEDLLTSGTLGFRGEALSSIAAVSQVEMITKTAGSLTGVRYVIEGGKEAAFEEIGAPEGTTFLVHNLFYNTPARKKFLKSAATEAGYVSDLMERMALSHPNISFKFINNRDTKLHTSGNCNLKDIIYHVYGREIAANLVKIEADYGNLRIRGFIGKPVISRGNRNFENYFVNGRYVRSTVIAKGIEDGYKAFLMNHRYPFTVLILELNPEELDVNVHPQKLEVRFANQQEIYERLCQTVKEGLLGKELIPEFTVDSPAKPVKGEGSAEIASSKEVSTGRHSVTRDSAGGQNAPSAQGIRYPEPFEKVRRQLIAEANSPYEIKYPQRDRRSGWMKPVTGSIPPADSPANFTTKQYGTTAATITTTANANKPLNATSVPRPEERPADRPDPVPAEQLGAALAGQSNAAPVDRSNAASIDQLNAAPVDRPNAASTDRFNAAPVDRSNAAPTDQPNAASAGQPNVTPAGQPNVVPTNPQPAASALQAVMEDAVQIRQEQEEAHRAGEQMELSCEKLLAESSRPRHKLIGQIFGTYWIVEFEDKLYIIDQHAAHEKVMYEHFMEEYRQKRQTSQLITPPVIVTLNLQEEELLNRHLNAFQSVGFEISPFGGREYAIGAVPGNLYGLASRELFLEILDGLSDTAERASDQIICEKIASMSCKAAVKGNSRLSAAEADALIGELLTLENPYNCPHGRPTIISMTKYELEKKFKRIV